MNEKVGMWFATRPCDRFVGMGNDPILTTGRVSQILRRMEAEAPTIKVTYKPGEKVRIVDGPFNDFHGTVDMKLTWNAQKYVMVNTFLVVQPLLNWTFASRKSLVIFFSQLWEGSTPLKPQRRHKVAKKVKAVVTLQIQAGKANPAPPLGPLLAQHGVSI